MIFQSKRFSWPGKGQSASVQFTSPINVKIIKETRELQREQHDLDTGEIRTWTETEEYEVLDLTEDTPDRVARTGPIAHADLIHKQAVEQGERLEAMLRESRNHEERLEAILRESRNLAKRLQVRPRESSKFRESLLKQNNESLERLEALTKDTDNKSLKDLGYKLEIRQLPVIKCPKLSNSTSNPSLNTNTTSSQLKSTPKPLLSRLGKENENYDDEDMSSTVRSRPLLGESPIKGQKLSSPSDLSLHEGSVPLKIAGSRCRSPRVRANSLRV